MGEYTWFPEYKDAQSWDWQRYGIPPNDSCLVGKKVEEDAVVQWGDSHEFGRHALLRRDTAGLPRPQDPYQKVVIGDDYIIKCDFGSVPSLFRNLS